VQSAGYFIGALVKLTACVQGGQHDLQRAYAGFLVHFGGYPQAVVLNRAASVCMHLGRYAVASPGQCFINRIVQHLVNKVMQPGFLPVADIHIRSLANRFKTL
jgi:hypothetical protein